MVNVELLDNRRIKLEETFKAPLNTVFEIWSHPNVVQYLKPTCEKIKSINTDKLLHKISSKDSSVYNEISMSSSVSNRLKIYSHFIEMDGKTEATITLDFKAKGLADRYLTKTTDKAVALVEKINQYIEQIKA